MKKTVALSLCCLMLLGSLSALAGVVQPYAECTHDYPHNTEYYDEVSGCWTLHYKKDICSYCGDETSTLLSREENNHSGRATKDPVKGWIVVCSRCGKELTYTRSMPEYEDVEFGWIIAEIR